VPLRHVAEPVVRTLLAVEDRRFFTHCGIDFKAILRAAYVDVRNLRLVQGGSTITQQLARMAVLRRHDRTLRRKLLEAVTAILIERQLTKEQILETYLNAAYFGHNIFGIELASLVYCGKPAAAVDEFEAAYLIGLLRAPAKYCYCCNPQNAIWRTGLALHLVGSEAHTIPKNSPPNTWRRRPSCADRLPLTAEYVTQHTRRWLKQNLSDHYPVHRLLIHTTIDARCQMILELVCSIARRLGYVGRAACIIQDAHSGAIRALAGGTNYRSQNFNTATDGNLQPGSLLKPFILLSAIQAGVRIDQRYESRPLTIRLKNGKTWSVRNAGERYLGWITLADALVVSDNTVYAQMILDLGIDRFRDLLAAVGINARELTAAISTGAIRPGVSPLQICAAYSVFSSGGTFYQSVIVERALNEHGTPIYQVIPSSVRVCSSSAATTVKDVLKRANKEGTGVLPMHHTNLAAKTGTSISGGWYASFDDSYRVLTWTDADFQPFGTTRHFSSKGVSAKMLASRIWSLLAQSKLGFSELYSVFAGVESMSVRDLLWVESQFQSI